MKKVSFQSIGAGIVLLISFVFSAGLHAQWVYLAEDFEYPSLPDTTEDKVPPVLPSGWSAVIEYGNTNWRFRYGGYGTGTIRHPRYPASGRRNALFQVQQNFWKAKLITPSLDLSTATKPVLMFYLAQDEWFGSVDYLNVYYRKSATDSWHFIKSYTSKKVNWELDSIQLEDAWLSNDFYIAFEGVSNYGWGVCIDSVVIKDSYVTPRVLTSVTVTQASVSDVPQGYKYAPILRIDFRVTGNTDSVFLTSLNVNRANTDVSNLVNNGVALFFTQDTVFSPTQMVGTATNFSGDVASFSGLHVSLPSGRSSVWVTYSIKDNATVGATLSAKIEANQIVADGKTWPTVTQDPGKSRKIIATIYKEDFEGSPSWDLHGEFEINSVTVYQPPLMIGYPHPANAYSGTKVLGTDLTGIAPTLGFYEQNLTSNEYYAVSPSFDARYYKDLKIVYQRCLNVKDADSAAFYAYDGTTWHKIWYSGQVLTTIADPSWRTITHDMSAVERQSNVKIMYGLGPTNNLTQMSGWTIDDIFVTGTEVNYDIAPTALVSPVTDCGLTSAETVTATFTNKGKLALTGSIPVQYSVNGGPPVNETLVIAGTLNPGQSMNYSFTQKINMQAPGAYTIKIKTLMTSPADDYTKNDSLVKEVRSMPTYSPDPEALSDFDNLSSEDWYTDGTPWSSWMNTYPYGYNVINHLPPPANNKFLWMTVRNNGEENSYVESPCYNLSAVEKPVITFDKFVNVDYPGNCGVIIKYSLDGGTSWNYLPEVAGSPSGWKWYDTTVALFSNQKGFSSKTQLEWETVRQFLPNGFGSSPKVKFRICYAGLQDEGGDGFAFDNFRIMEAPHDVGVVATSIQTTCETKTPLPVTVSVKNYGYRSMKAGDTIYMAVKINTQPPIRDTVILTSDLPAGNTVVLNFNKTVPLNLPGNYNVAVFTFGEKDPLFYGPNNDTLKKSITIHPLPPLAMPDSVMSRTPHLVTLSAGLSPAGDYDYLWYDNLGCNGCATSSTYQNITGWKGYTAWVRATNKSTGCYAWDTTKVVLLFNDLSMHRIVTPAGNGCDTVVLHPQVVIRHTGNDTLKAGVDSVTLLFKFKNDPPVQEVYHFTRNFKRNDTLLYTFTHSINLNQFNQSYFFGTAVHFPGDTVTANDSLDKTVWIYQPPVVSLGYDDTTFYGILFPMIVNVIPDIVEYRWKDLQTMQDTAGPLDTIYIATTYGHHSLTVTDIHGCTAADTAMVRLMIYDVSPSLVEPFTSCSHGTDELVKLRITNSGTDTITAGDEVTVAYKINNGAWRNGSLTLSGKLVPGNYVDYQFIFPEDLSAVGTYTFTTVATIIGKDIKKFNDTIPVEVKTHGFPAVDLCNGYTCVGSSPRVLSYVGASFTFDAGYNPDYTYSWLFGSTPISTSHTVKVSQKGTYTVFVTNTITGCSKQDQVFLNLIIPDVSLTAFSVNDSVCRKDINTLMLELTNTGNTNISDTLWFKYRLNLTDSVTAFIKPSSPMSPGTKASYIFPDIGSKVSMSMANRFDLSVYIKNDVKPENNDTTVMVSVFADPDVFDIGRNYTVIHDTIKQTIGNNIVLDPGISGMGYTYLWNTGYTGSALSVTNSQSGWYWLTVTNAYGCSRTDSVYVQFSPNTIIDISDRDNQVHIYPNPATVELTLVFINSTGQPVVLELMTTDGRMMYNRQLDGSQREQEIKLNVENYPHGLYILRISNSKQVKTGKVIIE